MPTNIFTDAVVATGAAVLSLDLVKQYLRVGGTAEDDLVQQLWDTAVNLCAKFTGCWFSEDTAADYVSGGGHNLWPFSRLPIVSVTGIYDEDAASDVSAGDYYLRGSKVRITYNGGGRWPEGDRRYRVTYLGGYGTTVLVPEGLKGVMLDLTRRAYDNRGGVQAESAAGWSGSWQELWANSDIAKKLRPYVLTQGV